MNNFYSYVDLKPGDIVVYGNRAETWVRKGTRWEKGLNINEYDVVLYVSSNEIEQNGKLVPHIKIFRNGLICFVFSYLGFKSTNYKNYTMLQS